METTIRKWFDDQPPLLIKFPNVTKDNYGLEDWIGVPTIVYRWEDPLIQPWLDLPFDDGFGTAAVPTFHAWTKDRVYYVWEYDGSTSLAWVPRDAI